MYPNTIEDRKPNRRPAKLNAAYHRLALLRSWLTFFF
jgi:hypothetical protein